MFTFSFKPPRCCRLLIVFKLFFIAFLAQATVIQQITAENAGQLIKQGPDAIGGIGDWHLSNGVLCAVVSDIPHETEFSRNGGVLVDLGFCDRADDHFSFSQELLEGRRESPIDMRKIEADKNVLRVKGNSFGVELSAEYQFDPHHPTRLLVRKTLKRSSEKAADFPIISLINFNYHSLEAFVFSSTDKAVSLGFHNRDFVTRGISAIGEAAIPADTIITVSPPTAIAPVAYGWQLKNVVKHSAKGSERLPQFALADEESIAMLIPVQPFWFGDGRQIGWLQLAQLGLMSLSLDETIETEEVFYVGNQASVSSITNQIFTNTSQVTARTKESGLAFHVFTKNDTPVTHARIEENQSINLKLPNGQYKAQLVGSGSRKHELEFAVNDSAVDLGTLTLPPAAQLRLPEGNAMRLLFIGLEGTKTPDFADTLTGYTVFEGDQAERPNRVPQIFLAGVASDPKQVWLAPGKYRVLATRGPEYSVTETHINIKAGEIQPLIIDLPVREIDTPGYIAADLHVHAGNSFDNTFSNTERVRTFVAEHGEVMVNSEHDVIVDFAPIIDEMGATNKIRSIVGMEMTSILPSRRLPHTGGHVNFFPVTAAKHQYRDGMIAHENKRYREILPKIKQRYPGVMSQLNHARHNLSLSQGLDQLDEKEITKRIDKAAYLDHMGVAAHPHNPELPLHEHPNNSLIEVDPSGGYRDLDFDAMELVNPGSDHEQRIQALRLDWFAFLLQGERITGTANSDSHTAAQQVAVPRNMVAVTNDNIAEFKQTEFIEALKAGNSYGTTGPMITLSLHSSTHAAHAGQLLSAKQAMLKVGIKTVSWVNAEQLQVQVNGKTLIEKSINEYGQFEVPLEFIKDSFVTIEVFGQASDIYSRLYPGLEPYAFSNPIYIDADADGLWQPPGLDTPLQKPLKPISIQSAQPF